jgi:NitT/TauT family transport system permease protein
LQIGQVMAGLLMLGLISFIADRTFEWFAKRLVWW